MSTVKILAHVPDKRTFEFLTADASGKLQISSDIAQKGGANNWLASMNIPASTLSAAFNCTGYSRDCFISISDSTVTNTADSWALFGSVNDTSYIFVGLLPRVKVGPYMYATTKVNLALFNHIKLFNTSAADQLNDVSATVLGS